MENPRILLVDDTATNIDLLVAILGADYELSVALNGKAALEDVRSMPPDLILLDVMMPGLNGFEVCEQLKADPATADIPVIFVTALNDVDDTARGFAVGGVDYVTKPIEPDILKARVRTHLRLRDISATLARRNEELESIVADRTRQLRAAHDRLRLLDATKQDYLAALSHELRTPANGVLGIAELALDAMSDAAEQADLRGLFDQSRDRLLRTFDNALLLARLQTADSTLHTELIELAELLQSVLVAPADTPDAPPFEENAPDLSGIQTPGNPDLLKQALSTLAAAARLLHRAEGRPIFSAQLSDTVVTLNFASRGLSPTPEFIASFFETFSQARASSHVEELGLGIPLAQKIILALGGAVHIETTAIPGARIIVKLNRSPAFA